MLPVSLDCLLMISPSVFSNDYSLDSSKKKDYRICICCFSAKHAPVRIENKDWLALNQINVSEWSDMSTLGLLFHKNARRCVGKI